jgi:hypothetical protein
MEILDTGGAFFGAVLLGRFFKILVLIPAGVLAIGLLLVRREIAGPTLLDSFLGIGLLIASLELGYVTGLISTDISRRRKVFADFWRALAARHRRVDSVLAGNVRRAPFTSRARCASAIRFDGIGSRSKPFVFRRPPASRSATAASRGADHMRQTSKQMQAAKRER